VTDSPLASLDVAHHDVLASRSARTAQAREAALARRRFAAVLMCCVVVFGVYLRSAWSYGKNLNPVPVSHDFQNLIADAFLAGQTNLRLPTPKLLKTLKNPYDANANAPIRVAGPGLQDLSYYKGKLYAYFGPAPAVLLFIPFRALSVGELSPTLACLIFVAVGFVFSLLLFQLLVRKFFGSIALWMECLAVFALGLAVPAAFIIYVGRAYEVSIACGYAELFLGLYFLARGLWSGREPKLPSLALASLFLGGAVAARVSYLAAGLFVVAAAVVLLRRYRVHELRRPVGTAIALLAPYLAIGVLLALYNYVRFGSISEFGTSYQLLGVDVTKYPYNQLWYVPHGMYFFLLSPARYLGSFPFIFLRESTFSAETYLRAYENEPVAGILTNMPVITAGLVMAAASARRIWRDRDPIGIVIALFLVVPLLMMTITTYALKGTTMRYELDWAPLLLLAGLAGWILWSRAVRGRSWLFWTSQIVIVVTLASSILFNLAITATPCRGKGIC